MNIKAGFIGTGGISHIHAEAMERLEGISVTAAYDFDRGSCERFCGRFGGKVFDSADGLISSPDVDVVYICTYHDTHAGLAKMAIEYDKAFFLEKPVAMDYESAKGIVIKQSETDIPCAVGFNMRVSPSVLSMKKILREKNVRPLAFKASMTAPPFIDGWAADPVKGGGVLVCLGSHMFDLIEHVLRDEIVSVCADTSRIKLSGGGEHDSAVIMLKLKSGIRGSLILNDCAEYSFASEPGGKLSSITIYSNEATVEADAYGKLCFADKNGFYDIKPSGTGDVCYRWGYEEENRQFIRLLHGEKTDLCSLRQGTRTSAVVDAARISAKECKWVEVLEESI